jgi:hypothetical protein
MRSSGLKSQLEGGCGSGVVDGGSMMLRNVGILSHDYTVSQPIRL